MKKLILFFTLLSTNAFAEDLFYCPETIVCAQEGNINSCQMVGGNSELWTSISANGKVQAATYIFQNAMGVYGINPHTPGYSTMCGYYYSSGKITTYLNVTLKESINLEAYVDDNNGWWVGGYDASCMSPTTIKSCPFESFIGKKR